MGLLIETILDLEIGYEILGKGEERERKWWCGSLAATTSRWQ